MVLGNPDRNRHRFGSVILEVESIVLVSASENKASGGDWVTVTSSGASSSSKVSSCNLEPGGDQPGQAAQGIHPQLPKGSHQRSVCRIAHRRWAGARVCCVAAHSQVG